MIKFHCVLPDVIKEMPIIPTAQHQYDWILKARDYYNLIGTQAKTKTTKCPGIFSVLGSGWIHRTYQEITIQTFGDNVTYAWGTPYNQKDGLHGKFIGDYVCDHPPDQLKSFKDFPLNTLHTVLKIQTPWLVTIPKGYSLLMMPIPYNDDVRFTAATGLLRGTNFLNVQLFWHCLNSREIIKQGTPINQMLLVKDEKLEHVIEAVQDPEQFFKDNMPDYLEKINENI